MEKAKGARGIGKKVESYESTPLLKDMGLTKNQSSKFQQLANRKEKAAALASYHRQSKDTVLMNRFMRIQARAIRRAGEVLDSIEPAYGANQNISTGDHTNVFTRKQAAKDAGMSKHQQVTAMKIARIPEKEFEELVESYEPPAIDGPGKISLARPVRPDNATCKARAENQRRQIACERVSRSGNSRR